MNNDQLTSLSRTPLEEWDGEKMDAVIEMAGKYLKLKAALEPLYEFCQTCGPNTEQVTQLCKRPKWWTLGDYQFPEDVAIDNGVFYNIAIALKGDEVVIPLTESEAFLW